MSYIQDAAKIADTNCIPLQEKECLLSKYEIPISHFEFDYIEKCTDGKELEKILTILRSGEEGYFLDLEAKTENRLKLMKPKSKLLRTSTLVLNKQDLEKEDFQKVFNDLNTWVDGITKDEQELHAKKTSKAKSDIAIRTFKEISLSSEHPKQTKEKRISSTDFKAWDKFDPDTEIKKMELEEQKSTTSYQKFKEKRITEITDNKEFFSDAESKFASNREREKGNEFFKTGEYKEAITCYTNSILYNSNVDNLNNRALTYLKLSNFNEAIADYQKVLSLDKHNSKAHLYLAEVYEKIKMYEKALTHVEYLIQQEPNNFYAQSLAEKIRKNCISKYSKIQMQITDIN